MGALTLYLILLCAVPSSLRVAGLGSAGSPAMLLGIVFLMWWASEHVRARTPVLRSVRLLPALLVAFMLALGLSYVNGMLHGQPPLEGNTADMGLIRAVAWAGLLLVAYDGVTSSARLVTVARRLVRAGALLSVLGLVQFALDRPLVDWVTVPGLVTDSSVAVIDRSGFTRPMATAVHPLEFGVVTTMTLPFAAVLALHDRGRGYVARFWPVVAIVGAISLSLSRSALVGLAATVIILTLGWGLRTRLAVGLLGLAMLTGIYVLVPGMASAVLELFAGIGTDDSTVSRIGAYGVALWVTEQNPLLGRGLGTFVPQYYILDNQWLLLLVESGVLGVAAFFALLTGGVLVAVRARRRHTDPFQRDLGQAFAAAVVGCAVIMAFFDGLSFPMAAGTLFLILGLSGAYARLGEREVNASTS
ncbi:O-antigen ligase family protein [Ornithinimicrobium pekingense]|uniref:O-antigen ligase family protein n=1 Tax=Ornithinimicrobium pekingense TaxID=384677 RepID=UPI0003B4F907|nr:O-antigen ligase family protein [Ornithinimicrobium pekingense]